MPWWLLRVYIEGLNEEFAPNEEGGHEDEDDFTVTTGDPGSVKNAEVVDDLGALGITPTAIS